MAVFAIADLHLSFGVPEKSMEFFGEPWIGYLEKIERNWRLKVREGDLVLIAGDISWAMREKEVLKDLEWIESLPGTKVMIRGNHDYWWSSISKVRSLLPPSIRVIQNDAFHIGEYAIGGTRLFDSSEYQFGEFIVYKENVRENKILKTQVPDEVLFKRELERLTLSLKMLDPKAPHKIVMVHYPPIGADLASSRVSSLLESYGVKMCIFGHLHNVRPDSLPFGERSGVRYLLTSCDYLNFDLVKIY
jgi:predicted phosphohydrolase